MFLIPYKRSSANKNMALDLAMLEKWPLSDSSRLRFYGWEGKPYTCGVSQKEEFVRSLLPPSAELVRRPSGGGIVFHGDDLTYALVAPRGSRICEMRAAFSYISVHMAICAAFKALGVDSYLHAPSLELGVAAAKDRLYSCFASPAPNDVMARTGGKLAGAAQKRNRNGILFQGSILPPKNIDRDKLAALLTVEFAQMLGEEITQIDAEIFAALQS